MPLISERLTKLSEIEELTQFFYRDITVSKEMVLDKQTEAAVKTQLEKTIASLEMLETWDVPSLESGIRSLQETHDWKKKDYFMLLRIVSTGKTATPPLFETLEVIGKEKSISRFRQALSHIS
jgi:glutamyl-tRNA synthetase